MINSRQPGFNGQQETPDWGGVLRLTDRFEELDPLIGADFRILAGLGGQSLAGGGKTGPEDHEIGHRRIYHRARRGSDRPKHWWIQLPQWFLSQS